jgi:hypothetical protein
MAKTVPTLDLLLLCEPPGMPALDVATGRMYADAAAVCLEDRAHSVGVHLSVAGLKRGKYCLNWATTTDQIRRSHNDLQDATRDGTYAVALMVARDVTGLQAIEQSRKGTGFDYWLGENATTLFQDKARLEVSGILNGDDSQVKGRLQVKRKQLRRSDETRLPGYACVVEFSHPQAHLVKR